MLASCSALSDFFSFFFLFLRLWRRLPPAATEDNYTNTDKSASTVTHSRVGVLPYATSYHLQRLCKTEKKLVKSGAGQKGERCAESRRDPGRWKEKGGSDHLAHRASLLDTLRSEKSHRFLKVPVTIFFFCPRSGCLVHSPFLSVPQWHFINTFLTILKISSSFGFWLTN